MDLKSNKILIVCFFAVLYLFLELILPVNSAFSHNFYDCDIEYEYCESNEDKQADQINIDDNDNDEDEIEEIDNDCFLDSIQISGKQCCTLQTDRLNLENLLSTSSQTYKTLQFIDSTQRQSIISNNSATGNIICILRTVILLN